MAIEIDQVLSNQRIDADGVIVGSAEQADQYRRTNGAGDQSINGNDRGGDRLRWRRRRVATEQEIQAERAAEATVGGRRLLEHVDAIDAEPGADKDVAGEERRPPTTLTIARRRRTAVAAGTPTRAEAPQERRCHDCEHTHHDKRIGGEHAAGPQRDAFVQDVPERPHHGEEHSGDHARPVQRHDSVEPSWRQADDRRLRQPHDQSEHAHHHHEADACSGEEQADPAFDPARPRGEPDRRPDAGLGRTVRRRLPSARRTVKVPCIVEWLTPQSSKHRIR